ncbi:MAG: CDP-alcohol phosphatidyltransferase family protein [Candidatus Sumerlaeia bacterium]
MDDMPVRRPIKTRGAEWAIRLSERLIEARVSPNTISLTSIACAGVAGLGLALSPGVSGGWRALLYLVAIAGIQSRLICNLLDGMVAVGGGIQSKGGEVFNDLPDRFSDALILVGSGYAIRHLRWGVELGWLAAWLAVMTAYVRVLGGSLGLKQNFIGPMAKPHRMAVMTGALALAICTAQSGFDGRMIELALAVIVAGCAITLWRRTARIMAELKMK